MTTLEKLGYVALVLTVLVGSGFLLVTLFDAIGTFVPVYVESIIR